MKRKILNEARERMVKGFLDKIVLAELRERDSPMSGYDVVTFIHEKW